MIAISRNALSPIAFGALAKPDEEWVWGAAGLIDQPGSCGEEFTFAFGPCDAVKRIAHRAVAHLLAQGGHGAAAVGYWEHRGQAAVAIQTLRNGTDPALPDALLCAWMQEEPSVHGSVLNRLMDGSSDGFWELATYAVEKADLAVRDDCIGLALRLVPNKTREVLFLGGPIGRALGAWCQQHALAERLPPAPDGSVPPKRL